MRKLFLITLAALLLGVGVVAIIETDPGYVLIAYGHYTLETSLWVGLLLFVVFTLLLYGLVRLLRKLLGSQQSISNWIDGRQSRQSGRQTTRGLINFIEGNWNKSRRQLLRGARHNESPMINYLMAAQASYRLNEMDKMREYLGAAEDAESEAGIAVELTQAEMKLASGQYEQALATLVRARDNAGRHPHVLDLLHQAYVGLKDWQHILDIMPEMRKYKLVEEAELAKLEREAHFNLLLASANRGDGSVAQNLHSQWQKIPAELKRDATFIHRYVELLVDNEAHTEAEKVILRFLKQDWDSELVALYGRVISTNGAAQLTKAESWLASHDSDAQLFLCLGRLSARENLWGKARDYFESAYRLERSAEVCAELGRLIDALGEPKVAAAYFREGLQLSQNQLPDLPMPQQLIPRGQRG